MEEIAIVIPNFNGMKFLDICLCALRKQTLQNFTTYLVDNGSQDESLSFVREHYPEVKVIPLDDNYGFSRAVNEGIRAGKEPYIILLNNDTEVFPDFVEELYEGIRRHKKAFSASSRLISYVDRKTLDDAGNFYNILGWAFARGKGKPIEKFDREEKIFSCCAGAAIYRRSVFDQIGLFDEEHFAYLEDTDVGFRARIFGYENWYLPKAMVYHVGSGTSGSRYNLFKIRYSSRNNVYMILKNMPLGMLIINFLPICAGFLVKLLFFTKKGFGKEYAAGIKNGFAISRKPENREKKVAYRKENIGNYLQIEWELILGVFRRFMDF